MASWMRPGQEHPPGQQRRTAWWLEVMAGPIELADLHSGHELLIARAGCNTAAEAAFCGIPAILLLIAADRSRVGEQVRWSGGGRVGL